MYGVYGPHCFQYAPYCVVSMVVYILTTGHVIQKYCSPASSCLPVDSIKRYGRQVLEALGFLQDKGFVMGKSVCLPPQMLLILTRCLEECNRKPSAPLYWIGAT